MGYFEKAESSRLGTTQIITYTQTSTAIGSAFGAQTFQVRCVANSACHVQIGDGVQTATTSLSAFLPANWVEYFTVSPGQRLSAIRAATDGLVTNTNGSLNVTEMS